MNVVAFIAFPPQVPTVICYLIYLYAGIKTKSCMAISSHLDQIKQNSNYQPGIETIWGFNMRQIIWYNLPKYLKNYSWQNNLEYDVGVAYHISMRDYYANTNDETVIYSPYHNEMLQLYGKNKNNRMCVSRVIAFIGREGRL
jgi:hypothetical protein